MDKSLDSRPPPRRPVPAGRMLAGHSDPADLAASPALRALTEHLDLGIVLEDRHGRIRLANRRFCSLFGLAPAPAEVAGMPARTAARRAARQLHEPEAFLGWIDDTVRGCEPVAAREWECGDGRVLALGYTPVDQGALAGLWQCRDVTERRRVEERLRALAQTDELTGLPNRRHALGALERERARSRRSGRAVSVLMLDLDRFKQINDARGHAAGDGVLCDLSSVLVRRCRTADTAARLGGDEFLVILPDTSANGCCEIAERLLREVRGTGGGGFSISIGATTLGATDASVDAVLARVDRALYAAKGRGRDCMCYLDVSSPDVPADDRQPSSDLRSAG